MAKTGSVYEGRTFEEAAQRGLEELRLSRAEAVITLIEEGKGGFLGFGAKPFRVSVLRRPGGAIREPEHREERRVKPTRGSERGGRAGRGGRDERRESGGRDRDRGRRDKREDRKDEGRGKPAGEPVEVAARAEKSERGERSERGGRRREGREGREAREPREGREPREERRPRPQTVAPLDGPPPAVTAPVPAPVAASADEDGEDDASKRRRRRGRRGGRGRRRGERPEGGVATLEHLNGAESHESEMDDDAVPSSFVAPPPAPAYAAPALAAPVAESREPDFEHEPVSVAPAAPDHAGFDRGERRERPSRGGRGDRGDRGGRDRRERGDRGDRGERVTTYTTPELTPAELEAQAIKLTDELLRVMGFEPTVTARAEGTRVEVMIEVAKDDELLTGHRGETRQALQQLLNRYVNRGEGNRYYLQLEVNDFWQQREGELAELAGKLADEAVEKQVEVVTDYLNSQERRIVHVTLKEDARVRTYALGTGMIKRVAIAPASFPERTGDEADD